MSDLITVSIKAVGYVVNILAAKSISVTVILCRSIKTHVFSYSTLENKQIGLKVSDAVKRPHY